MSIIKVNRFKGYSSQRESLMRDPAKLARCENLIIHKGYLRNLPYPKDIVESSFLYKIQLVNFENFVYVLRYVRNFITGEGGFFVLQPDHVVVGFTYGSPDIRTIFRGQAGFTFGQLQSSPYEPIHANIVQFGNFVYILNISALPETSPLPSSNEFYQSYPRMAKLRVLSQDSLPQENIFFAGLHRPERIESSGTSGGGSIVAGTYGFAFSFKHKLIGIFSGVQYDVISEGDRVESNATRDLEDDTHTFGGGNGTIVYRLYLPFGYTNFEPGVGYIVLYVRTVDQAFYYQVEEIDITNRTKVTAPVTDVNGRVYVDITLSTPLTQDTNIVAEFDKRLTPNASAHAILFKNRAYWCNAKFGKSIQFWSPAQLQYSQLVLADGREANYIEGALLVGKQEEGFTGVIEFQRQLVLFKESETHVLSDDATLIGPTILFEDLGSVNLHHGKAQIVIEGKLYFGCKNKIGIYRFDGQTDPLLVSRDIEEDLENLDSETFSTMTFYHDPQIEVLYVVCGEKTNTNLKTHVFIYHYNEIQEDGVGVWTKYNPSRFIDTTNQDRQDYRHFFQSMLGLDGLTYQTQLKDDGLNSDMYVIDPRSDDIHINFVGYDWLIETIVFDLNDVLREKYWKLIKLESSYFLRPAKYNMDSNSRPLQIISENLETSSVTKIMTITGTVALERILKQCSIRIRPNRASDPQRIVVQPVIRRPFKINGMLLDVYPRGRR